jgi:hypothetical protein
MTDTGPAVGTVRTLACGTPGMRHPRTWPYRPRINGRAVAGSYI